MAAPQLKVLISGAGIAGPCLAYWLTRTRLATSITIVERSPVPRVTGQSIDIRGPAIEIMKKMGLEEAVRAKGTTEEGTRFVNAEGKVFADFEAGESFTAEYEILRADLCGLFMETTQGLKNVNYVYGDSIKSLNQTTKSVDVTFANGGREAFDLVVAADGAMSKARSMILDTSVTEECYNFLGQYIAFFSIPSNGTDTKHWYWYNAPKGLSIHIRPHRNSNTMGAYLVITTPSRGTRDPAVEEAMDKGIEAQKAILHEYLKDAGWQAQRVLKAMDTAEDFYMSRSAQVRLPKWTEGRGVVLGDAAHATFGVGTTLAIQSAYLLAGELGKTQSTDDVPEALERFERVYRPMYKKMEELPPGFPQFVFPQTRWGLKVRDAMLWVVSKTKLYKMFQGDEGKDWKMEEYGWKA